MTRAANWKPWTKNWTAAPPNCPTALLADYDGRIKALLGGVFGPENDFDAALGGVNLAGVAANGKRVVQNLLEALAPILQQGAQRHLEARAEAAEAEAAAARAARGAE